MDRLVIWGNASATCTSEMWNWDQIFASRCDALMAKPGVNTRKQTPTSSANSSATTNDDYGGPSRCSSLIDLLWSSGVYRVVGQEQDSILTHQDSVTHSLQRHWGRRCGSLFSTGRGMCLHSANNASTDVSLLQARWPQTLGTACFVVDCVFGVDLGRVGLKPSLGTPWTPRSGASWRGIVEKHFPILYQLSPKQSTRSIDHEVVGPEQRTRACAIAYCATDKITLCFYRYIRKWKKSSQ